MTKYNDLICRYYASHADIPDGEQDGALVGKIIRCRDCKRWNTIFGRNTAEFGLCQSRNPLEVTGHDDYCSRAERCTDDE